MKKILLQFETETLVWGRREKVDRRTLILTAGEHFAAWDTAEAEGAVRFTVAPLPRVACTAQEFVLREGEKRPFSCSLDYECAEDCVEEIITGTAEIAQ